MRKAACCNDREAASGHRCRMRFRRCSRVRPVTPTRQRVWTDAATETAAISHRWPSRHKQRPHFLAAWSGSAVAPASRRGWARRRPGPAPRRSGRAGVGGRWQGERHGRRPDPGPPRRDSRAARALLRRPRGVRGLAGGPPRHRDGAVDGPQPQARARPWLDLGAGSRRSAVLGLDRLARPAHRRRREAPALDAPQTDVAVEPDQPRPRREVARRGADAAQRRGDLGAAPPRSGLLRATNWTRSASRRPTARGWPHPPPQRRSGRPRPRPTARCARSG